MTLKYGEKTPVPLVYVFEVPIHWPPDGKSQLIGKDPDAGKG